MAAACKAVKPLSFATFGSAPCSISSATMARSFVTAACINGVVPTSGVRHSILIPCSIAARTLSTSPLAQLSKRDCSSGVRPRRASAAGFVVIGSGRPLARTKANETNVTNATARNGLFLARIGRLYGLGRLVGRSVAIIFSRFHFTSGRSSYVGAVSLVREFVKGPTKGPYSRAVSTQT